MIRLNFQHSFMSILLLTNVVFLSAFTGKKTVLLPRPHSSNTANLLIGWYDMVHQCKQEEDMAKNYWVTSINPTYMRSFGNSFLSEFLFGREAFKVQGSRVEGRSRQSLFADYFGLPSDFNGMLSINPVIDTFLMDINFYWALNQWADGLYFRIQLPIGSTNWDLGLLEKVRSTGNLGFPAGYMGKEFIPTSDLPASLESVMDSRELPVRFGDMQDPIRFGRVIAYHARVHFSNIVFAFGYDFMCDEHKQLSASLDIVIPSGTRSSAERLFAPVIGNDNHTELGVDITGHYKFWNNNESNSFAGVYSKMQLHHLFKAEVIKSYDFNSGLGSRYMLLERVYRSPDANVFEEGPNQTFISIPYQYGGSLVPAINHTTLKTETSFAVQVDWSIMGVYHQNDNGFHLNI